MPNILIIGTTGYIGSALCGQLLRSGNHRVFGLAKSENEGFHLQLNEIIPLFGSLDDVQSCLKLIIDASIEVVVDTNSFNNETTKPKILDFLVQAAKERLSQQSFKVSKIGFVTVSGIWCHGSTEDPHGSFKAVGRDSLSTSPRTGLPAAKARYEQEVLNAASVLDIAIIRPHFIFARGGAAWTKILSGIFEASQTGSSEVVRVPVDPEHSIYSFTNIDDVATGLELAIDKIQMINGSSIYPVFDLVGDQFPIGLLIEADAKIFGCKGRVELYKPEGVGFLELIGGSSDARPTRAEQVLGWRARRGNFVRDTEIYAKSFLASLKLSKEV
jgi:nucleoside-diphosphate-sugar epimerase